MTIKENIMHYILQYPGATDTEIRIHLKKSHQSINQACRDLESNGYLVRKANCQKNNNIGNYPSNKVYISNNAIKQVQNENGNQLQEDEIKKILNDYLLKEDWEVKIAWGHQKGIDIDATKEDKRWIIEVKGPGSRQPMRVNYFLSILGEILQRMDDVNARYSIAFPDIEQYRLLWDRLPKLSKERTKIDLILIDEKGNINFVD